MSDEARKKKFKARKERHKKATAEATMSLDALDKRTTKKANSKAEGLKIKGSMKVGAVEKLFDKHFGVTFQIKDKKSKKLVPNEKTIGQASREEY